METTHPAPAGRRLARSSSLLALATALAAAGPAVGGESELRELVERYSADRGSLERTYTVALSAAGRERMQSFGEEWLARLAALDFAGMSQDGKLDWLLLRNELEHELRALDHAQRREDETLPLVRHAPAVVELLERRRRLELVEPRAVAGLLTEIAAEVVALREELEEREPESVSRAVAHRAMRQAGSLRRALERWHGFYSGYDPLFTWWVTKPYEALDEELERHAELLKERFARAADEDALIGDPIGREALLDELAFELVPYTPEELIETARREFEWCDAEMLRASNELGFGDDWRAAQDHVKDRHVEPGAQPEMIRELAEEAIEFLERRELLTIPPLAVETWRMEMMSPERQKTSPYFLGGEVIIVSFPTDGMDHEDKLMSMRGNNVHFSRATVHHELIPGHHLQGFMNARHKPYRRAFRTPFWVEGWALYWEMLLWDLDFPRSPEDRIGMLFWRKHRCARIVFSLSFHLGAMNGEECVDYLVERVGHERRNAEAEVRRSIAGDYGPLYQAAYMLGGLQLRALRAELVRDAGWSDREFHDAVLRENAIPIELLRAALTDGELIRDFRSTWRFAD